jgi:hypothetical protein
MAGNHGGDARNTGAPAAGPAIQGNAQQAPASGGRHVDRTRPASSGKQSKERPAH